MQYETLTDLLNNEAGAYNYFYSLSPEMQTSLWQRTDIRSLTQLRQAAADVQIQRRPGAFLGARIRFRFFRGRGSAPPLRAVYRHCGGSSFGSAASSSSEIYSSSHFCCASINMRTAFSTACAMTRYISRYVCRSAIKITSLRNYRTI